MLLELKPGWGWSGLLPGLALAALLHSGFNHLIHDPKQATLATMLVLPALFISVFLRSEQITRTWLGEGFDSDLERLELLNASSFGDSHLGRYLHGLKQRFDGLIVADMLCYARLATELSLRAKGLMMMRENGFEPEPDEGMDAQLAELAHLEKSIGRSGLRVLRSGGRPMPAVGLRRAGTRGLDAAALV